MKKGLIIWSFVILLHSENTLLGSTINCGIRKIHKTALIVRGHDTEPGEWPWHVAIFHRSRRTNSYACGGTLISELFVLTAGHCVISGGNSHPLSKNRIYVQLGVYNLDELNTKTTQQHGVEKIHQPKSFTNEDLRNDIALLELATTAQFNDYVQPVCMSLSRDLTGQFGTVVGWGVTEDDETSPILKSAQMPVIDPATCLKSNRPLFGATLDEDIFCAGYTNGTSVCNGDSGGGIFFDKDNVWYLGGIVSFTEIRSPHNNLCNTRGYAAFTKVYTFLQWISSITKQQFLIGQETLQANDQSNCAPRDADTSPKDTNLLPRDCGVYVSNRIVKGQNARAFEFPWMAIMIYREVKNPNSFISYNAGTLINSRYVLTSATVVTTRLNYTLSHVRLGEHTKGQDRDCNELDGERECAPPVRDYGIECIIKHQNFKGKFTPNDIALIRLEQDVVFESHIKPICLPVTPELRKLRPLQYIVTGWGQTSYGGNYSDILLKATIPAAGRSECQEYISRYGHQWDDSQLCVGETNGGNACNGDTGAPLGYLADYNGMRFVQFGIYFFGYACNSAPEVYTNIAFFMDWLLANMRP